MYKLYIKNSNGVYEGPYIFKTYDEVVAHAKGEYLIIKREHNTDELIKYKALDLDDEER